MLLKKKFKIIAIVALLAPWRVLAEPSLLEPLRLLMQGAGGHDIFSVAFEAQIGIPPEYADVVFWDSNTGDQVSYGEIRDLVGPSRQDGVLEMMILAEAIVGTNALPVESGRLARLIDAAYLASMRRPPQHVAVEFFDTRVGPVGDLTGGISGHSPLNQRPPESAEERLAQLRERHQAQADGPGKEPGTPEQNDWPTLSLDDLPRAGSEQEARLVGDRLTNLLTKAGVPLDIEGVNWSRSSLVVRRQVDMESALEREMVALDQYLAELSEVPLAILDPLAYQYKGQLYLTLVVFHAAEDTVEGALVFRERAESLGLMDFNPEAYRFFETQRR